jgi:GT2 family glycosyltransferase
LRTKYTYLKLSITQPFTDKNSILLDLFTLIPGRLTISIVLYKNDKSHLSQLCQSLLLCTLKPLVYFIDNSPTDALSKEIKKYKAFHYQWRNKNLGYGQAHNIVIERFLEEGDYHLAMNADVYFGENTLERITSYMDQQKNIGLLLPRVLNPDNTEQPLYKLLPKPGDLLLRRFLPGFFKSLFKQQLKTYRMDFASPKDSFDAPYLSGCFMFLRKKALKETGGFDPRFFLYCEDVDLSRRIRSNWRTTYFADVHINHYFNKGSYREMRLLYHHVRSAISYFNKHGWFRDYERDLLNQETLKAFELSNSLFTLSSAK